MRWALVTMRLCAACRNTSVRRTTGTAPDEMTSASTWPGPTEGSWSVSPTTKRAALSGTAFTRACISMTSTMDVSSTTNRSQSSGLSSPRLKPPPFGSTSRSRWMVLASKPVASVMRLAARPVGAQSRSPTPLAAPIGDDRSLSQFEIKGGADQFYWNLEQLLGKRYQLIRRQAAMSFVHGFRQRIGNAGTDPDHGGLLDAELHRNRVSGPKADAADM